MALGADVVTINRGATGLVATGYGMDATGQTAVYSKVPRANGISEGCKWLLGDRRSWSTTGATQINWKAQPIDATIFAPGKNI